MPFMGQENASRGVALHCRVSLGPFHLQSFLGFFFVFHDVDILEQDRQARYFVDGWTNSAQLLSGP